MGESFFSCLSRLIDCSPLDLMGTGLTPEEFLYKYHLKCLDSSVLRKLDALKEFLCIERDLRRQECGKHVKGLISSDDVAELAISLYSGVEDQEEVTVLYLDRDLLLLKAECIAKGSAEATIVPINAILRHAIEIHAGFLILVHNHVKQFLMFSEEDISVTVKLWHACKYADIELLDHVLVGICGHVSYRKEVGFHENV